VRGSITIATVAGIPIRIHWTFAVLLAWVFAGGAMRAGTVAEGLVSAAFTLCVFACVGLHELGHALAARRFGVRTRDITLLPIGGVARLERIPENPLQEFVIAVAGPIVNVVIAAALFTGLIWQDGMNALLAIDNPGTHVDHFLATLAAVNVWLVLFNMIPAFPMDGGRVLRAVLTAGLGHSRATRVAGTIGQALAVLMALAGLFVSPMLILVAMFVWIGAASEALEAERRSLLSGLPASAAMLRRYQVLAPGAPLRHAVDEALAGPQAGFAVTESGHDADPVVGVLTRDDLIAALVRQGASATVADAMRRDFPVVAESDPLERAVELMRERGCAVVPVLRANRLVGLLTPDSIAQHVAVRSAGIDLRPA